MRWYGWQAIPGDSKCELPPTYIVIKFSPNDRMQPRFFAVIDTLVKYPFRFESTCERCATLWQQKRIIETHSDKNKPRHLHLPKITKTVKKTKVDNIRTQQTRQTSSSLHHLSKITREQKTTSTVLPYYTNNSGTYFVNFVSNGNEILYCVSFSIIRLPVEFFLLT